jgi:uncharacterized protein YegP (UPF0339 family)
MIMAWTNEYERGECGMKICWILTILAITILPMVGEVSGQTGQTAKSSATTGSLRGRVKEQKGRALAGVTIKATEGGRQYEMTSDGQGEFHFRDLTPGEYVLSFSKTGYKTFTTRSLTVAAGDAIRLSRVIEMAREDDPYSVIRGAVLHGVGYSLPNASIRLERIDGRKKTKMETVSREGGEFAFRLKADAATYRITAEAEGFEPASVEITIENDEVRNIVLTLKKLP